MYEIVIVEWLYAHYNRHMTGSTISAQSHEALRLLASSIKVARKHRGWTTAELAERIGVSRQTMAAIEAAKPGVAIGTVFEAATLVGVPLFSADEGRRGAYAALKDAELALLPATVRARKVDDAF